MVQIADLSRAAWRTSSYSNNGGNCVEVADSEGAISVRDTKACAGAVLAFSPETWERFTARIKG